MGPVNHIINNLRKSYQKLNKILSYLHIQKSKYHGRKFEGNQSRKILTNIRRLNIPDNLVEFKNILLGKGAILKPRNIGIDIYYAMGIY